MQRAMSLSVLIPEYVEQIMSVEPRISLRTGHFSRSRDRALAEAAAAAAPASDDGTALAPAASDDVHWHEEAGYLFTGPLVPASRKAFKGQCVPAVGKTRELVCAVCLEDFEVGDKLRIMPCSHSFHQRCIFRWLRISRHCPYCRLPLTSVDEQPSKVSLSLEHLQVSNTVQRHLSNPGRI